MVGGSLMVEGWIPKGVWEEWVAVGGRGISEDQTWDELTCQESRQKKTRPARDPMGGILREFRSKSEATTEEEVEPDELGVRFRSRTK